MKTAEIRQKFLEFFKERGHEILPSSSLIPENDPTLLFTNAGMVPFKDLFLGREQRSYSRATTSQRCVRAGGKHNDLENVGYTARHHTFFEMLGNFSFGDYFKREAIQFSWLFLTEALKLPKEKLWITVFEEDDEAADIWINEIGIDPNALSRCGEKDNFWAMGDTGPCGPCSEIFYDHGPEIAGGPPGSPEEDGDRYIEIWNLVFMQYDRTSDGKIKPLPKPSVDTGMGLERIAAVLQGVHNNYDIDIFQKIIKFTANLIGISDFSNNSLRVIADHIRSSAFLIIDGVTPSNEGRGYVLRRIIRRALRHGHQLGFKPPFFYRLVEPLVNEMGEAYPELVKIRKQVEQTLQHEEELFAVTLDQGMKIFEQEIAVLSPDANKIIPGSTVFKLYDTYGFPMDLTADIARERGMTIDEDGFHAEMNKQRARSQAASQFNVAYENKIHLEGKSDFTGYNQLEESNATIRYLIKNGEKFETLGAGDEGAIILDQTPFYAESGGQVGDSGLITADDFCFEVVMTRKQGNSILHYGMTTKGCVKLTDTVHAKVEHTRRQDAAYNHSATHLLNATLRELLGDHVLQRGSLVEPERLRFDFSHFEALTSEQLKKIEQRVNQQIRANLKVTTQIMTPEEAMDSGAMALFGEKYGAEVRVLSMGDFSMELCGGTHVTSTGDIGFFKIISESGIAAGIRRIEAVTGRYASAYVDNLEGEINKIASLLHVNPKEVMSKTEHLVHQNRDYAKEISRLKSKLASNVGGDLSSQAKEIDDIKVLACRLDDADPATLRDSLDRLKDKLQKAAIVLASVDAKEGKITLVAGVTKNLIQDLKAGALVKFVAEQIGGKGGGRPDMAQGGGTQIENLDVALKSVEGWVEQIAARVKLK